MQNAGQFGPGTANQVHQQQSPQQQPPAQYHPPESSPTGSSSTTSLRQFRKKDVVEKGPEGAGAQKLEARVAPHSHYPPSHQPPDYRYPSPMGHHQYQDYSPNSLGSQPKYDLSENHHSQNSPISTSVIQKPKHMEICQQPPGHVKATYPPHQLAPSGHHQGYAVDNSQILQSPTQMHASAYKPAESQYYPKEQYHQIPAHHAQKYHQMMPPQNLRKYQNPGDESFLSKQDTFLSKLSKLNPTMARSIMSEHHLQETLGGQPPAYPGMEQRGMYQNNQRYYPGSMHPSQMGYSANNYPPMNYANYSPSCNYTRSTNMGPAPPNRYNPQLERDISPSRRPYSENLHHMAMCATMSQKLPNYPPQYNPPPEYAQHYRHRRDAMPGVPQEYYQQPGAYGRPPQYMGGHQLPSAQGIPDVVEAGPVSLSDNLKKFVENWMDEEEIPAENNPTSESGTVNVVGDQIIQVSMVNPSDVPFLENRGIPVVTQEMTTEGYQYLIKTGIDPQMVKIIEANKESGGVVRLHIVDQPKTDCMMANQNQTTQTGDNPDNKKVVVHQNKVIQPFNSNVLTSDFVERIPNINQNLENIGVCQPNNATCSDTKELVDKNCSPINLTDFNENLNNKELAEARESCIKSVESKPEGSEDSEGSRSPTGSFKSMPIIDAFDNELNASNKMIPNFDDNDTNHHKNKDVVQTYQDLDHEAQKLVDSICGEAENIQSTSEPSNPKYQTHDSILESEAHTANQKLNETAQKTDLNKSSPQTKELHSSEAEDCRENNNDNDSVTRSNTPLSNAVSTPKSSPDLSEKHTFERGEREENSVQYAPKNYKRKRILSIEDIIYPKSTKENEKLSLFHSTMVFINREKEYSSLEIRSLNTDKENTMNREGSYDLTQKSMNVKSEYDKSMNIRPSVRKRRAQSEPLSDNVLRKKLADLNSHKFKACSSKKFVTVSVNTEVYNEINQEAKHDIPNPEQQETTINSSKIENLTVDSSNQTEPPADDSAIIVISEDNSIHSTSSINDLYPSLLGPHSAIFSSHIPLDQKFINVDNNPLCLNLQGSRIQIKIGKINGKIFIKAEQATNQEEVDINDNYALCSSSHSEIHSNQAHTEHSEEIISETHVAEDIECSNIIDRETNDSDDLEKSSQEETESPEKIKNTSTANQPFPYVQANSDRLVSDLPEKLPVEEDPQVINSTDPDKFSSSRLSEQEEQTATECEKEEQLDSQNSHDKSSQSNPILTEDIQKKSETIDSNIDHNGVNSTDIKKEQLLEVLTDTNHEDDMTHQVKYEETDSVCSLRINNGVSSNSSEKYVETEIKSEESNESSIVDNEEQEAAEPETHYTSQDANECLESTSSTSMDSEEVAIANVSQEAELADSSSVETLEDDPAELKNAELNDSVDNMNNTKTMSSVDGKLCDTLLTEKYTIETAENLSTVHEKNDDIQQEIPQHENVQVRNTDENYQEIESVQTENTEASKVETENADKKSGEIKNLEHESIETTEDKSVDLNEESLESENTEEPVATENMEEQTENVEEQLINMEVSSHKTQTYSADSNEMSETIIGDDNAEDIVPIETVHASQVYYDHEEHVGEVAETTMDMNHHETAENYDPEDDMPLEAAHCSPAQVEQEENDLEIHETMIDEEIHESLENDAEKIPLSDTEVPQTKDNVTSEHSDGGCDDFLGEAQESIELSSEISELPQDIIDCPIDDHPHEILVDNPLEVGLIEEIGRISASPDHMLEIGPLEDLEVRVKAAEEKLEEVDDKVESSDDILNCDLIDKSKGKITDVDRSIIKPNLISEENGPGSVSAPFKKTCDVIILSPTSTYNEDSALPSYRHSIYHRRRDSNECSSTCSAPITKAAKKQYDSDLQSTAVSTTSAVLEVPTSTEETHHTSAGRETDKPKECLREVQVYLEKLNIDEFLLDQTKKQLFAENQEKPTTTHYSNVKKILMDAKPRKKEICGVNETLKIKKVKHKILKQEESQHEIKSKKSSRYLKRSKRIDKKIKYKEDQKDMLKRLVALRIAKGKVTTQEESSEKSIESKIDKQESNFKLERKLAGENHEKIGKDDDDYADFTELVRRHRAKKKKLLEIKSQKVHRIAQGSQRKPEELLNQSKTNPQKERSKKASKISQNSSRSALCECKNTSFKHRDNDKEKTKISNTRENNDLKITIKISENPKSPSKLTLYKVQPESEIPTKCKSKTANTTGAQNNIIKLQKVYITKTETADVERNSENKNIKLKKIYDVRKKATADVKKDSENTDFATENVIRIEKSAEAQKKNIKHKNNREVKKSETANVEKIPENMNVDIENVLKNKKSAAEAQNQTIKSEKNRHKEKADSANVKIDSENTALDIGNVKRQDNTTQVPNKTIQPKKARDVKKKETATVERDSESIVLDTANVIRIEESGEFQNKDIKLKNNREVDADVDVEKTPENTVFDIQNLLKNKEGAAEVQNQNIKLEKKRHKGKTGTADVKVDLENTALDTGNVTSQDSTAQAPSKTIKPKKIRHIRKADVEKDEENIAHESESTEIEEGEISGEDKSKDDKDPNIIQPLEIMTVPLVRPIDTTEPDDPRRNTIVVPSVSELLDENKSSSKRRISLQDYKKKRKIDAVSCSSETDSKSESESPLNTMKGKRPKLNEGAHLAKSLSFEEALPNSVERSARKMHSVTPRRKSVDFSPLQIKSGQVTVEYSLEGKRMDPRLKIRKEEPSKNKQVQSYFTSSGIEGDSKERVDKQKTIKVVEEAPEKPNSVCRTSERQPHSKLNQTSTPSSSSRRGSEEMATPSQPVNSISESNQTSTPSSGSRRKSEEVATPSHSVKHISQSHETSTPSSSSREKSKAVSTPSQTVKHVSSNETTNKILLNSSNEWEDTNSPKQETESTEDCLNVNFSGLIIKNSRPIIDVDELKLTIDPEYNVDHEENDNPPHPVSLEEYRERIDSELSSLSINIPKSSRDTVKQYTTFNIEDIKRPVDQNEVVQKFLNGGDISKTELEIITKLITYKRLMSQTKDCDSPSGSSGNSQRYELKNPGDDRMKLHFKKLNNKRKLELQGSHWEDNVLESDNPSSTDEVVDRLKPWEVAPTTVRKPGGLDYQYRVKEPTHSTRREDYSVQMQYSSPEKNKLPKIIFKRTKTSEEPVVVLERLPLGNVKDLGVNGT